jgi:hypothetical protein
MQHRRNLATCNIIDLAILWRILLIGVYVDRPALPNVCKPVKFPRHSAT